MNDEFGRRPPPAEHRWRKGMSGNPKGRPKRVPSTAELLHKLSAEKVAVREGAKRKQKSRTEVQLMALVMKAVKGDIGANHRIALMLAAGEVEDTAAKVDTTLVRTKFERLFPEAANLMTWGATADKPLD